MTNIRGRFLYTIAANLARSALSFATGLLVARWLEPTKYGTMAFLLGTFLGVRQLLDMGTSAAFFTFLSQKAQSRRFVFAYFAWLGLQFLVTLLVVGLLFPDDWIHSIWRGEHRSLVLLAFTAAFMQGSTWPIVQQAGEAVRKTVLVQFCGVAIAAVHFVAVLILWQCGVFGMYAVFAAIALEHVLASIFVLTRLDYLASPPTAGPAASLPSVLKKYLNYCAPLIPYAWLGFANEFCDRWLLQAYGGSVQQAYYAVGAQFAGIALIATTSVLRIFWKEIAEAHFNQDHARIERLYRRVSRLLFLIGALIAGFLIPWSKELLQLALGANYTRGAPALAIMFLYPVHQSMGQICGTMLYATERVGLQVTIGICTMLGGMGLTYLALAPPSASIPGFGLGSEGLAWKMVVTQIVAVNITSFVISRVCRWRFDWLFQPLSLSCALALGYGAHIFATKLVIASQIVAQIVIGGTMHVMLCSLLVLSFPQLAGMQRNEFLENLNSLRSHFRRLRPQL
jgi:O-antigen/teichoic acid export membrane protein